MKIIAWNVNGIRAIHRKKILEGFLSKHKPDVFCVGETKLSCPDNEIRQKLSSVGDYSYRYYSTCTKKKGYSGTLVWSRIKPLSVGYGFNMPGSTNTTDPEGRIITLEFNTFYLIHVYVPNSGEVLQRLEYRTEIWDKELREFVKKLQKKKPVVLCGDMNCANENIDIHNINNSKSAGFTPEERKSFKKYFDLKLVDIFRTLNPTAIKYTYWSYRGQARKNNKGWRIDYFLISKKLIGKVISTDILSEQMGSDHAPIELTLIDS